MPDDREIRGEGWLLFASILMVLIGVLLVVQGLLLLAEDSILVTGPDDSVVIIANVAAWGVAVLIVGAASILAGVGVYRGWQWARWFGIAAASFTVLSQVGLVFGPQPLFSLIIIGISVLTIYGLAVYGGQDVHAAR